MTQTPGIANLKYDLQQINRARMGMGWSWLKLAEEAGVAWRTIQKFRNGNGRIAESTVGKVSQALGLKLPDLVIDVSMADG